MRSSRTPQALREFAILQTTIPQLQRFADPAAVLTYLEDRTGNLNEKDALYAALVGIVQARGAGCGTASTLLWLGLWPVLTALYRSKEKDFENEPEELVSEISEWFLTAISRADLSRISRVAATLARNTERNLGEQLRWDRKATGPLVFEADLSKVPNRVEPPATGLSVAAEVEAVHRWVERVLGEEDANLVVGVAVFGESQAGMGDKLGLSHDLAQRRYHRAIGKLRAEIQQ
jgi:DNA-directed RNA polymerase specialized sigma24 family protein